jgi:hypothetical protein
LDAAGNKMYEPEYLQDTFGRYFTDGEGRKIYKSKPGAPEHILIDGKLVVRDEKDEQASGQSGESEYILSFVPFRHQTINLMFHFYHLSTQPSDLNFFLLICWHLKTTAYHVFRKYRLKTIYIGTNFSSFLDFRLILSITAQ